MKPRTASVLFAGLLLAAGLAWAQQEPDPVSHAEFINLLQQKTPVEEVIRLVRQRGVNFTVTPRLRQELEILGIEGEPRERLLAAITEPGSIELATNAPGAEVTVDGDPAGEVSPEGQLTLSELDPGLHMLRLRHKDYVRQSVDVFLKPGEVRRVSVDLQPAVEVEAGPLGKEVRVAAGTPADERLSQLDFVTDPEKRLPLLRRFVVEFSDSPVVLLAHRMLQQDYLQLQNYESAIAAGETLLERDPQDFSAKLRQARAYAAQGDPGPALDFAERAVRQLEDLEQAPAPEGTGPDAWQEQKQRLLTRARGDLLNLSYHLFVSATRINDPARKRALLERFVSLLPETPYTASAYMQLAFAAQQQGDTPAALEWAGKGLEDNPDQPYLLVLVADTLSEKGEQLDRARRLATRLLELIESRPGDARPEGMTDEQWVQRKKLWQGTGHTVLGQVLLHEERAQNPARMAKTRQAVEHFRQAAPLLKHDTQSYARNLFRLGFAYAKLGELQKARTALNEVMQLETPYTSVAADVLERVNAGLRR